VTKRLGGRIRDSYPGLGGLAVVELEPGVSVEAAVEAYSADPDVLHAQPNYEYRPAAPPNDEYFDVQWGLHNTGTYGTADADIDAPQAWDLQTGSAEVVVAVIDTGVDYTHPDLKENMWVNPREVAGNGIDDDNNGYIDDVHGVDTYNDDGDPMDSHGHGTHVAGIVGASGNNSIGVSGVSWDVSVMALRVADDQGTMWDSTVIEAIEYARVHGAKVVNCSWGGEVTDTSMYDAMDETPQILYVCAAGNEGSNLDGPYDFYPAEFDLPNVLTVGWSDQYDQRSESSNYGAESVDVFAPGQSIASTVPWTGFPGSSYNYMSGTSMAAPHVAGIAALMLADDPSMTVTSLKDAIMASADAKPALAGYCVTGARVNAYKALTIDALVGDLRVVEVAGDDRIGTAIEAAGLAYPDGASTVVITTAYNWPDALAGAALAGMLDAPILLTATDALPAAVASEVASLGATAAVVLGGTSAVSSAVEGSLESIPGVSVRRVAGPDRYATARTVASEVASESDEYDGTAFVVTGLDFPDALGASPLSAAREWPVYLVNPASGLDQATVDAMREAGVTTAIVVGGEGAVPAAIEREVKERVGCTTERIGGATRYETAVGVATYGVVSAGLSWDKVALATGEEFPDALSGGALQGKSGSVMLLTPRATLNDSVRATLSAHRTEVFELRYLGGTEAVGTSVRSAAEAALRPLQ
jgi:subtilisin family serine protease